ncbi:MAG: Lrp/AsnC family transcriptional regulator [Candidatus Asgardarchaeia archaeon]
MVRISNLELLRILKENSRIPFVKIAKIFGVSETAVRKRIKKLEKEGIIKKYTIEVNLKKIGLEMALIGMDTKPEYYISTIEKLKEMDEVVNLYASSGDHMIMIECWFKSSEKLRKFIKTLESMEGVTRVCPAIILEKIK